MKNDDNTQQYSGNNRHTTQEELHLQTFAVNTRFKLLHMTSFFLCGGGGGRGGVGVT